MIKDFLCALPNLVPGGECKLLTGLLYPHRHLYHCDTTTATSNDWTRNSMVANQTSSSSRDLVADLLSTNNTLNIVTVVSAFVFGFLAVYGCYLTVRHQRWERLRHRSIGLSQIPDNVSWEQKS